MSDVRRGWTIFRASPMWCYFDGSLMSLCGRWYIKEIAAERLQEKTPNPRYQCRRCAQRLKRKGRR